MSSTITNLVKLIVFGKTVEFGQSATFYFNWDNGLLEDPQGSTFNLKFSIDDRGVPCCTSEGNAYAVRFNADVREGLLFSPPEATFGASTGIKGAIELCAGAFFVDKLPVRLEGGVEYHEFVMRDGYRFQTHEVWDDRARRHEPLRVGEYLTSNR